VGVKLVKQHTTKYSNNVGSYKQCRHIQQHVMMCPF